MNAKSNTIKPQGEPQGIVYSYLRWSSEPQTWGDSERRQECMASDWCQRNGRKLADLRFADRGVSGWKGDNRKSGRLEPTARASIVHRTQNLSISDTDTEEVSPAPSPPRIGHIVVQLG